MIIVAELGAAKGFTPLKFNVPPVALGEMVKSMAQFGVQIVLGNDLHGALLYINVTSNLYSLTLLKLITVASFPSLIVVSLVISGI